MTCNCIGKFRLGWCLGVSTWLNESLCRGGGHPGTWWLSDIMGHVGWWCGAVSCCGWWWCRAVRCWWQWWCRAIRCRWRWWWWSRAVSPRQWRRRHCWVCGWVHMISHRAAGRCAHGSGWPHLCGCCVALPAWSQGWLLLWVWVVATGRHSRRRRCCLCSGWPWAGAGRLRRSMGCWTSHWRPGQQWLTWRSWVRSGWWTWLVGTDRGDRLVRPGRVQTRAWGWRSFGLHWIVGWLMSHSIADSRWLLQANWILWWSWKL